MSVTTIVVGAIAAALGFIAICIYVPARSLRNSEFPNLQVTAVADGRRTLAQILGAAAVILTFTWTFLKDSESLEQARQQIANQEFMAAATQLFVAQSVPVKAAAIYSLGRVASTRSEYLLPMRDTLAAYVRDRSRDAAACGSLTRLELSQADLQAAITVLAMRKSDESDATRWLNLSRTVLVGVDFSNAVNLRSTNFRSSTIFGANFQGADLSGSHLEGLCAGDWQSVGLTDWNDSLPKDPGWEKFRKYDHIANFAGATLKKTDFGGAVLSGADFSGTDLEGARFAGANLSRADFTDLRNVKNIIWRDGDEFACADVPVKTSPGVVFPIPPCRH